MAENEATVNIRMRVTVSADPLPEQESPYEIWQESPGMLARWRHAYGWLLVARADDEREWTWTWVVKDPAGDAVFHGWEASKISDGAAEMAAMAAAESWARGNERRVAQ